MSVNSAYLDHAAATPLAGEVLDAMMPYLTERFENPSAPYARARAVRDELEASRATCAHLIGARADNLVFCAGATEATNLAFGCVSAGGHVVVDAIEHESVLACAREHEHTLVGVDAAGRVSAERVAAAITPATELVSIELANGEIGTIQPVREIARVVEAERVRRLEAGETRPIWLHTDASQAAMTLSVSVSSLRVDLMTLSAAKIGGPKQVGALWAADGVRLAPVVVGGGQEGGLRSGTQNVAGAVGMARALELACERRREETTRLRGLRQGLERRLREAFPTMRVWGPTNEKMRLPQLLSVSFEGLEARRLVVALERRGVSVGTGSACAASKMRVSHVLAAIGATEAEATGSLRFSLGHASTAEELDYAAEQIIAAVADEAARVGVTL